MRVRSTSLVAKGDITAEAVNHMRTTRLLRQRLAQKVDNYQREALRLERRGQHDAADVLQRAAGRLKILIRNAA